MIHLRCPFHIAYCFTNHKLVANVHSFSISNCIFEPKSWLLQLATAREHWRAEIGEVVQDTISGYRGWQPQPLGAGQTEIKQTNPSAFDRTKCGIAIGKLFTYSHIFMQFYCFNFHCVCPFQYLTHFRCKVFGSDRSSRNANLRSFVCSSVR